MSDILTADEVAVLRQEAAIAAHNNMNWHDVHEYLTLDIPALLASHERLRAERDALREALTKLSEDAQYDPHLHQIMRLSQAERIILDRIQIARAALAAEKEQTSD